MCSLTVLDFFFNKAKDEILSDLKSLIFSNNCLEVLHLHNNSFTSAGGKLIATVLQYLKHLRILSIDENILSADVAYQMVNSIFTTKRAIIFIYKQTLIEASICFYCCLHKINALLFCKTFSNINAKLIYVNVSDDGEAQVHWTKDYALTTSGILQIIKSLRNVTTVKVSDNHLQFTEQEVNNIAAILSRNGKLENVWLGKDKSQLEISLHYDFSSNVAVPLNTAYPRQQSHISNISPKLIKALKSKNLLTLDLSGNVMTEELLEDLQDVLANSTKLETLLLRDCSSIPSKLLNAANCSNLKVLDLSRNYFVKEAMDQVASILIKSMKLETYNLEDMAFSTGISQQLIAIKSKNLKVLNLSGSIFTTEATLQLVTVIKNCNKLEKLLLKFSVIENIDKVVAILKTTISLNELNLSWCNIRLSNFGNM